MAVLKVVKGLTPEQIFPLERDSSVMGRHPDCDIVVDVGAVSRRHAKVMRIGGAVCVEDMQSRNGTFVNEELISRTHFLRSGDQIRICDVVLTYDEMDRTLPNGWRTSAGRDFSLTDLIDPSVAEPLIDVEDKLDRPRRGPFR